MLPLARARLAPALLLLAACAPASRQPSRTPAPAVVVRPESAAAPVAAPLDSATARVVARRVGELQARGGDCARYGAVLERSLREGRIAVLPYMWRVGGRLASGEARPNGDMRLARDVDPLNPGVRTLDDLLWTLEHEAAHIAFDLRDGPEGTDRANGYVARCRGGDGSEPVPPLAPISSPPASPRSTPRSPGSSPTPCAARPAARPGLSPG